jgi:hypothetical protein
LQWSQGLARCDCHQCEASKKNTCHHVLNDCEKKEASAFAQLRSLVLKKEEAFGENKQNCTADEGIKRLVSSLPPRFSSLALRDLCDVHFWSFPLRLVKPELFAASHSRIQSIG